MLLLVPSAMQEDLCEGSLTFTEKEHYKRNIIGIPSTRSFLPEVPMGTDRGGGFSIPSLMEDRIIQPSLRRIWLFETI